MRPLRLTLAGFRSHERTTELSFEDRSLLAIVGPTGAGKSSILDGISYALYGKTPREQRAVKKLICSRSDEARVQFRFSVDGRDFEITRVLRRKPGPAPHVLHDHSSGETVTGEASVTEKVIELVGLDFSGFSSSVLLAQGEFAQFLRATPTDRGRILKGVFRLEQVDGLREAARSRVDQLGGDLREIEGERRGIPPDVEDLLSKAAERKQVASRRAEVLVAAIPREQELEAALKGAARELEAAVSERARLQTATKAVPTAGHLEDLQREGSSIDELIDEAKSALSVALEDRTAAVAARATLEAELGSEVAVVELRSKALELGRVNRAMSERQEALRGHERELETLSQEAATAEAERKSATEAAEAAIAERLQTERAHAAHALRAELEPGEPCPVCEVILEEVPTGKPLAAIEKMKARERKANDILERATRTTAQAATALAVAEAKKTHLVADLAASEERKREIDGDLGAALGAVADPLAEIEHRLERLAAGKARVEAAGEAVVKAEQQLHEHEALRDDFARLCRQSAAALIGVAGLVGVVPPGVDDAVERLLERAAETRQALAAQMADVEMRLDRARRAEQEIGKDLNELRAGLDLPDDSTIAASFAAARSEADRAEDQCADLEKKRVRAHELDEQEAAVVGRQNIFKQLAADLTDRKFISFLLEEKTQLLLELASERLNAMTSRYRLEMDNNELNVIDELDADKRRVVNTLSGGETFLASLALALALAELVTRAGGRLQCFFLDEGFGSLDPESFDLAMEGIERIVSEDRLIGLVSHVPALAARVDDRIVLDKGADGMTVVRDGAALG